MKGIEGGSWEERTETCTLLSNQIGGKGQEYPSRGYRYSFLGIWIAWFAMDCQIRQATLGSMEDVTPILDIIF